MSNRILGLLVIAGCILFAYLYIGFIKEERVSFESAETNTGTILDKPSVGLTSLGTVTEMELEDKISYLKRKNNSYAVFVFEDEREFYFIENGSNIDLYRGDDIKVASFDKVNSRKISILPVYGDINHIFIKLDEKQYLLSIDSHKMGKIEMKIPIKYIKSGGESFEFLLVTDKGTFEYESLTGDLDYFSYFKDFIYIDNYYIGVVEKDETVKLNNLGFENETKNLIVRYNPSTKEKDILFRTELAIDKIIYEDPDVIIIDTEGEKYRLENFK